MDRRELPSRHRLPKLQESPGNAGIALSQIADYQALASALRTAASGTTFVLVARCEIESSTRQRIKRKETSPWHCRHECNAVGQYDPFELAQREFDTCSTASSAAARRSDGGGAMLAPYGVDVREDQRPHLRRGRAARLQEGRGRHHAGKPDADDRRRAPDEKKRRQKKGELLLHERRYTRFLRSFTLPPTVDEQTRQRQARPTACSPSR